MGRIVDQYGRKYKASAYHEGATTGRRLGTWGLSGAGPNTTLYGSLANLRNRSQQLERNTGTITGAVNTYVAELIGKGITPKWNTGDPGLDRELRLLWDESHLELDVEGTSSGYGLQALATRSMIVSGESFARHVYRRKSSKYLVPFQVQLLESNQLDETHNVKLGPGHEIAMGIELKDNERLAYHFYRDHPGEQHATYEKIPVKARNVSHLFKPLRPGMKRGRPWMAAIILKMYDIDQTNDAELVRRKVQNMFGGFITRPPDEDDLDIGLGSGEEGDDITALEPGLFPELPLGADVKFASPPQGDGGGIDFMKHQLREAAKGLGLTYDQFTGDLKEVNFTSLRAGLNTVRRAMEQIIYHQIIYQFCMPIGRAWQQSAVYSGTIKIKGFADNPRKFMRCTWTPAAWPYVKPSEDVETDKKRVRNGFASVQMIHEERNVDTAEVLEDVVEMNRIIDEKGLAMDTDPRKITNSGQFQVDYGKSNDE